MDKEAKLYVVFDMLGDLVRSGPLQWKVDRFRTEDVKDHVFDLILMTKLIKPYIPSYVDTDKMIDYAIVHDLEEVITGDITKFQGVSSEEKARVNKIAMDYLIDEYGDIINLDRLFNEYESRSTLEAKILLMLDKVNSSVAFLKYDNEKKIDMDNPEIIESLRNDPGVVKMKNEGYSLGDLFYVWHLRAVKFTDEEIVKYNISKEDADIIVNAIKSLMASIREQILRVKEIDDSFPEEAKKYRRTNQ